MAVAPNSFAAAGKPAGTVHPIHRPPDLTTTVSNGKAAFVRDSHKRVYGDSGVTLSLSVAKGHTWTGTFT